jgi:hypothetical protein
MDRFIKNTDRYMEAQETYIGFLLNEYGPLVINLSGATISSIPTSRTDQIMNVRPNIRSIKARTNKKTLDGKS